MGRATRIAWLILLATPLACSSRFDVDGNRAYARVVKQVEMGPRVPGMPGHEATLAWIERELSRLGARVERQSFHDISTGRPLDLVNLIAHYGPAASGRRIAICAHWDTRPWSDQDPDSTHRADPVPGANDGASGVAVLLELAELMSRQSPPVAVDLVFFDGEDQGTADSPANYCIGSRFYAARVTAAGSAIRPDAAFLFDMVGDRDLGIHPEIQSEQRAANIVAIVNEAARATAALHFHPIAEYTLTDDHVSLLDLGIPAVDVVDFDYPAWHTHRDLPDQVSPQSLAEVAQVAAWIVYRGPLTRVSR
jgi:hypothetical protein